MGVTKEGYQCYNFFIIISWELGEDEVVDEYRILTNTTTQSMTTNTTTVVLEGKYNIPLEIRVSAINCAGTSTDVTEEVFVGKLSFLSEEINCFLSPSPSAGCGPPSLPVNGSVGEWTSSRVGAQVTYSCDTHLVLVGETVATCSLPSLTWLPSSDDVMCQPGTVIDFQGVRMSLPLGGWWVIEIQAILMCFGLPVTQIQVRVTGRNKAPVQL